MFEWGITCEELYSEDEMEREMLKEMAVEELADFLDCAIEDLL